MLRMLNYLFHIIHVALILFVVVGWSLEPLRTLHLVACSMVLVSWFVVGTIIGKPGYCIITGIQFRIRSRLGLQEKPQNYMAFLCQAIAGKRVNENKVDIVTQAGLYIPTALSTILLLYR